ncbi:MAG: hypothetical protein FWD61_18120 [Phycisphaerales bacterium]|nr:hypothetical protein [Phycisphaerales bacterium]
MENNDKISPERLLAAQSQDPNLKLTYEQKLSEMFKAGMPSRMRWLLAGFAGIALLAAIMTVIALVRASGDDFLLQLLIPALIFELSLGGGCAWVAWRGKPLRTIHVFFAAFILGNFSLVAAGILNDFMAIIPPEARVKAGWVPTLALILGWLPMVLVVNSHYHERTREKLLEIQYQIAELAERMSGKK